MKIQLMYHKWCQRWLLRWSKFFTSVCGIPCFLPNMATSKMKEFKTNPCYFRFQSYITCLNAIFNFLTPKLDNYEHLFLKKFQNFLDFFDLEERCLGNHWSYLVDFLPLHHFFFIFRLKKKRKNSKFWNCNFRTK